VQLQAPKKRVGTEKAPEISGARLLNQSQSVLQSFNDSVVYLASSGPQEVADAAVAALDALAPEVHCAVAAARSAEEQRDAPRVPGVMAAPPNDNLALVGSAADDWAAVEVPDDYWVGWQAGDHSSSAALPDGCSAAADWAVAGNLVQAGSVPADSVRVDYWAPLQAGDHSAPAVPPDDCSAAADWVVAGNLAQADSVPADSVRVDYWAAL